MAELLTGYLRSTASKKFAWGACSETATDCYWWVVRWLEVSRGRLAEGLREKYFGRYDTALGGWRLIYSVGGLEAALAEVAMDFGLTAASRHIATPGSVAIVDQPAEPILGIVAGRGRAAVLAPAGLAIVRRPLIKVWS